MCSSPGRPMKSEEPSSVLRKIPLGTSRHERNGTRANSSVLLKSEEERRTIDSVTTKIPVPPGHGAGGRHLLTTLQWQQRTATSDIKAATAATNGESTLTTLQRQLRTAKLRNDATEAAIDGEISSNMRH